MMIAWMIYCVVVGALLIGAALAAEWIARVVGKPVRWTWASALALLLVLAAVAPARRSPATAVADGGHATVASIESFRWESEVAAVSRELPSSAVLYVAAAWLVVSGVLVGMMLGVHVRWRRARVTWPVADIQGTRVRVSPDTGPVVIGLNAPEIVVPRWLLERTPDQQRLVVAHEVEHVAARDTWLHAGARDAEVRPAHPAVAHQAGRDAQPLNAQRSTAQPLNRSTAQPRRL